VSGAVEAALRDAAPRALSALVRRHGRASFDECEEAVQEALLAASVQWPREGLPASPSAWLIAVASRRLVDVARSEAARRRREAEVAEPEAFLDEGSERDDTLTLLFLCCHPSLSPPSQLALTLRAVGGLTTAEIAAAFLVDEATMAQRISRAKARVRGAEFTASLERLDVVMHVLYLLFNEGYTATSGEALARVELSREAIRLVRMLRRLLPGEDEVTGLLALMLLTDARRPARLGPSGLVPLEQQDRSLWDGAAIAEGLRLVAAVLASGPVGPYQLQAAIAAVHAEAARAEDTDWPQILALYDLLAAAAPNPMVSLNRAVAVGMVSGPAAGLAALDGLDEVLAGNHRLDAVRAHLLADLGDTAAARDAFLLAASRTTSVPERTYLESRAASLLKRDSPLLG
jgi:RNA polymerase sigma factor (sigma-70 family)